MPLIAIAPSQYQTDGLRRLSDDLSGVYRPAPPDQLK
jgi:hypothetical protein